MKKFTILFLFFFAAGNIQAQFDKKRVVSEGESKKIENVKLNLDQLNYKPQKKANKNQIDYSSVLQQNFADYRKDFFQVEKVDESGNVQWMRGRVIREKGKSLNEQALNWLDSAKEEMNLNAKASNFELINSWTDELNQSHFKFDQFHNGFKVYGAQVILHGDSNGIFLQNGTVVQSKFINEVKASPISEAIALDGAIQKIGKLKDNWNDMSGLGLLDDKDQVTKELVYYKDNNGQYNLTYHFSIYKNLGEHFEVFVDGYNGKVIDHYSTVCKFHDSHDHSSHSGHNCSSHNLEEEPLTTLPPDGPAVANSLDLKGVFTTINTYAFNNTFYLIDGSRTMFNSGISNLPDDPVGAIWTIDLNNTSPQNDNSLFTHVVSNNNSFVGSPEGVSAHANAGQAYEYFKNTFNRESISGNGQNILSFINVADEFGNSYGGAFWNGLGIFYGNGDNSFTSLGKGLDVAGHEMSHGVVQSTADLEYRDEPGAMNESFADIFGAMIDRDDWQVGEDVVRLSAYPSGALRDISDPHNGAATGDFNRGWQPRHYNERFTGPEDNGGVHLNSGIPNYAFYLFATDPNVGKARAEQVYYRALTTYLTRSSGFDELRLAVVKSADDLYNASVVAAARSAFDQVGITNESEGNFQENLDVNPGQNLLIEADSDLSNLFLRSLEDGELIFDPLSQIDIRSKPSVTDDGSLIVFTGQDNHVYAIELDWNTSPVSGQQFRLTEDPVFRNAVISKDGRLLALLESDAMPRIVVFDLVSQTSNVFDLINPTFTEGINTGDVRYADAMEFDATGTVLMFDALNEVLNASGNSIQFWDIGFLEVWNPQFDTWALGNIDKLFGSLPEGIDIGNPTFAKNSPFIISFDVQQGNENEILGINLETRDLNSVIQLSGLGYPNYSTDDNFLIYDLNFFGYTDLGVLQLNEDKISRVSNSDLILSTEKRWGVWFSNGERILTNVEEVDVESNTFALAPNPVDSDLFLNWSNSQVQTPDIIQIFSIEGKLVRSIKPEKLATQVQMDVSELSQGSYILKIIEREKIYSMKFMKN